MCVCVCVRVYVCMCVCVCKHFNMVGSYIFDLSQGLSTTCMNSGIDIEIHDKQMQDPANVKELHRIASGGYSPRCSLPIHINHSVCAEKNESGDAPALEEFMEKLIHISNARTCWAQDDDAVVDLTEPRFESFCVANVEPTS